MSLDDSAVWRARAAAMRALVDDAHGRISKELLLRIAEDYEWFADAIERRPDRFQSIEPPVPAEVRRFGSRGTAPPLVPDHDIEDIPDFLRRTSAPEKGGPGR